MAVDRPTFSESWHRVADLRPRLRASVHTHRQQFRGQLWYVLADAANNQHYRLNDAAYHMIASLDGRHTVSEAWKICNDQFGDAAPTQGEAIRLLGQLYVSNLLRGDLPPDAQQVFERHRKRIRREVAGHLTNFLFVRIPLIDPQNFLQRWVSVVGWIFGPVGLALWLTLIGTALFSLVGQTDALFRQAQPQALLKSENLFWLYACFVVIKVVHELGHGFACVHLGRREGVSAPVHTMGLMLLVFMPVPYVDASSSWTLRSKWRRAIVGAAGMYVEIAVAAIAAIVWAKTAEDSLVHAIAYNAMFIASISTLLFNGNPLLRFDGYYILSDLLEIANLAERSKQYLYYLVKSRIYGLRRVPNPAHTSGERFWLSIYAVAAMIYRVLICVGIILFVADMLFIVGVIMALAAVATWVIVPLCKFLQYLATSSELERTRLRAVAATGLFAAVVLGFIGLAPMPDRARALGVVEPAQLVTIHTVENGWIESALATNSAVTGGQTQLLRISNRELESQYRQVVAQLKAVTIRRAMARGEDPAMVTALSDQIAALTQRQQRIQKQLDSLSVYAPTDGVWISPDVDRLRGVYLTRGQPLGHVANLDQRIVRVPADQSLGPRIEMDVAVELRIQNRPETNCVGRIDRILPAGQRELPSAALGYAAGGAMPVAVGDESGRRTTEPFFEIVIRPAPEADQTTEFWVGQRAVVLFTFSDKPLAVQWWRAIRQLIQRRFSI